jgi:hypothetical protein
MSIYERRAEHLANHSVPTLGVGEALAQLRGTGSDLKVAQVHTDQWNFVIFVASESSRVVTCLAVDASAANPDWDYSDWQQ